MFFCFLTYGKIITYVIIKSVTVDVHFSKHKIRKIYKNTLITKSVVYGVVVEKKNLKMRECFTGLSTKWSIKRFLSNIIFYNCLLYTSDAADE